MCTRLRSSACLYKFFRVPVLVLLVIMMSGCSTPGYYLQSLQGQFEIIQKRQPISALLATDTVPVATREKLAEALRMREFASRELLLPDNDSYLDYADLGRDYVVWNVFATPELSLQGRQWCFLIVGCLGYRGYFAEADARKFATQLEQAGDDVYVGGVTAYSTLGWFADPVLNTMLRRDSVYLARIIFHELAHQKLYIKNDTEFNEAFADSVAEAGVMRWVEKTQPESRQIEILEQIRREDEFITLLLGHRQGLHDMYQSTLTDREKRVQKALLLQQLHDDYALLKQSWNGDTAFDAWFAHGVNNAKLLAVATYRQYLPGFRKLLSSVDFDLSRFYARTASMTDCTQEQRHKILLDINTEFTC